MNAREIVAQMINDIRASLFHARGHRVTDSEISSMLGVSPVTFCRVASGVQAVSLSTFLRVCKVYFSFGESYIYRFVGYIRSLND